MAAAVYFLTVVVVAGWVGRASGGFPMVTPTVGDVWPRPQTAQFGDTYLTVTQDTFTFVLVGYTCDIVEAAIARYTNIIFQSARIQVDRQAWGGNSGYRDYLDHLSINLYASCETYPNQDMDEQYELKVDSPESPGEATLASTSVWGILRGLETFSQLLVPDSTGFTIRATQITDFPRFGYRGLMLDTSRHFIPPVKIYETLDLMAMNKLNVFHWHIVDDQSFPFVSVAFPDISTLGAYTPQHVYTVGDVAGVVEYARLRGIRVVPEFDTPGHTRSWGPGQPNLLTECYTNSEPDGTFGPIDPSRDDNFAFLSEFFSEVTSRFPDPYVHLGADEVDPYCWETNPYISYFMEELGISGQYGLLEEYYISRLLDTIAALPSDNAYLVWQDVFDKGVNIAADTVVQVWKEEDFMAKIEEVTAAGFFTILSSCWYLNLDTFGSDWFNYYTCDPHDFSGSDAQKQLVLGGEACVWTEYEDRTNLIPRTWPRASLVAEKLWSDATDTASLEGVTSRLDEQRCRLLARGYDVEPLLPSYCTADVI